MTKQVQTKEERKAANKALAAEIRALVAKGKADQAYALVTDKGEHWTTLVNGAVSALKAKADKAANKAKADKAPKAPKAKAEAECNDPCDDPECGGYGMALTPLSDVQVLMEEVQRLQAALEALTAPKAVTPIEAVREIPRATFILRDPEAPLKGFAFLVAGKVGKILAAGDKAAITEAKREATECAKWCDTAALAESDKAERDRLQNKAGVFRKAVATLKAGPKA